MNLSINISEKSKAQNGTTIWKSITYIALFSIRNDSESCVPKLFHQQAIENRIMKILWLTAYSLMVVATSP